MHIFMLMLGCTGCGFVSGLLIARLISHLNGFDFSREELKSLAAVIVELTASSGDWFLIPAEDAVIYRRHLQDVYNKCKILSKLPDTFEVD